MKRNKLKKILSTFFTVITLSSSISYCMENGIENENNVFAQWEEEETKLMQECEKIKREGIFWPSDKYVFPNDEQLKIALNSTQDLATFLSKTYGKIMGGDVKGENFEKKQPQVSSFRKYLGLGKKTIAHNINILKEDAKNGGYNACLFQAANNINTIREKLKGVAFEIGIPNHAICAVIMDEAKPTVIETRQAVAWKNEQYEYAKYDLIDYIKLTNTEGDNMTRRGHAVVDWPVESHVATSRGVNRYAIQVNLALRMIVLFRLNAYMKNKNDKKALEDAKNLANYICKMEQTNDIALWPICIMGRGNVFKFENRFSNNKEKSQYFILFPPYESLKQLLDEEKYDEYIKKELSVSSYIDLYDIVNHPGNKSNVFIPIINHLENTKQNPLLKSYGNFIGDNYINFMRGLKSNSQSYSLYYDYIKDISENNMNYAILSKNNFNSVIHEYKFDGAYVRYTHPIWHEL